MTANETNDENINEETDFLNSAPKSEEKVRTKCGDIAYFLKHVTVEPVMGLLVMSTILTMLTTQNLSLEKACRVNLQLGDEICDSLKAQELESQNEYEKKTQQLLTRYLAYRTYITATIPCVLAMFVGSYSDKTGHRKIFIIIPLMGQILACISNMINVYFLKQTSLEVLIFGDAIIEALSGGWCLAFLTMFSYISTITLEKDRTFRMGMLNFSLTVGFPIGMGLSGILLKKLGYYGVYGLSASLHTVNVLYNIFVLKEPKRTEDQMQHDNRGFRHFCYIFFNWRNVRETFGVLTKKGTNNRRVRLIVMMIVVSLLFGPMYGEISVLYLSTRFRFSWDEVQFSIFQSYNFVVHTVGAMFSISVFSKYLQWHDAVLGIISNVSKIVASFFYCFAPNEKIFFIAPLVEILNGTSLLAIRSIVSKMVEPNELGKVNSVFGLTENLMPLLYVPLYTNVYKSTMDVLPGAVFLMGAAMTLPALLVFCWLFYENRKEVRRIRREEKNIRLDSKNGHLAIQKAQ